MKTLDPFGFIGHTFIIQMANVVNFSEGLVLYGTLEVKLIAFNGETSAQIQC